MESRIVDVSVGVCKNWEAVMTIDLQGYYAILDVKGPAVVGPETLSHADRLLAAAPCCLQLRAKGLSLRAICELGHALRARCSAKQVPLCINDRLDVALAVDADIVHLGQNDFPVGEAIRVRAAVGRPRLQIGISASSLAQAEQAVRDGADHVGLGPIFATQSKVDADPTVGLAALAKVAASLSVPVVAIRGITLDNVADVARAGASAAAVIAAVDTAADPTAAGRRIGDAFRSVVRPSRPART